jgi:hypothetical protein
LDHVCNSVVGSARRGLESVIDLRLTVVEGAVAAFRDRNRFSLEDRMGFMDRAKQLAEQAQAKLDEAQKQFNERQSGGSASQDPAVEYDKHGRPIRREGTESAPPAASPPPPTPPTASAPPAAPPTDSAPPAAPPTAPPAAAAPTSAPPSGDSSGAPEEDPNKPDYAPPKLSSGDPLAG